jgi:hypothetical protein
MFDKNVYRVCVKTSKGHLYYLSDDNMSTPGVGPEGESNLDSFTCNEDNFAFLSNCTPEDVYHFSTKEKAKEAIDHLPFPYNEKSEPIEVATLQTPLYKRIYYRIGKMHCPIGTSWLNLDGSFTPNIPEKPSSFVNKSEAEEFLSTYKNIPVGTDIFEVYDFGEPDFTFWYRVNSGAVFSHDAKLKMQRNDIDIKNCSFGDIEIPKYVFYRFCKKSSLNKLMWLYEDNTFEFGVSEKTLSLHTLNDAKKYAEQNSFNSNIEIVEVYSSGDPDWKWNYKVLSTGKVYTSEAVEITS